MHAVKWLQAESVIYDHCTGTVKKNRSTSTAVITSAIFTCPGRSGLVFRLDSHTTHWTAFTDWGLLSAGAPRLAHMYSH